MLFMVEELKETFQEAIFMVEELKETFQEAILV